MTRRKYSELKSVRVKSSPFLGRGKGLFFNVKDATGMQEGPKPDLRGKPCGVGQTKERDGCIPNAGSEQAQQQPQQQIQQPVPKPIVTGSAVSNSPDGKLQFDSNKIQEQPKPSEEQVFSGNKQSTNKWEPVASKINENSNIDQKAWDEVMPKGMTKESCAVLTGLDPENPNAYISVRARYLGDKPLVTIRVADQTAGLTMTRKIKKGGIVENESFLVDRDFQGHGIGTEMFSRQVETLVKAGMKRIECLALRDSDSNGYYTWPRLGYNAEIENIPDDDLRERVNNEFPEAKTIQDLYKTKEGREWWKTNGNSVEMEFDLSEGSQSRQILAAYLEEKQKQRQKKKLTLMRTKRLH